MLLINFIFHLAVNLEGSRLEEIPRPPSYTRNGYFPTNELTYSNLDEFGAHPGKVIGLTLNLKNFLLSGHHLQLKQKR